jgi:ABC-type amino acid transport substrate-binding protein
MGVVAEFARTLEASINARYKSKPLRFHVDLLPTARDRLFQALNKGYGDAVAANLTITPERLTVVDFVDPWLKRVKEIIVAGPSSPKLDTIEDLAGQEIRVRDSSIYAGHLAKLSDAFLAKGLKPISIKPIDDNLEDEDLIEMVNAGLLPYAVVDDHEATIWTKIFPNAVPRTDLVVSEGGEIACAIRKNSPELKAELNAFFRKHSASAGIFIPDTNAIESLNAKLRRAVRTRGHFPTDDATMKLLYLVLRRVAGEWKMPPREWCEAKTQFAIMFDERLVTA